MNFLVVDDNSSIRSIVSSIIKWFGHGADEANDGLEAIQKLQKHQYDVVITDAEMPNVDGAELCKLVKAETPNLYIVGMSGCPSSLNGLKEAGADICLSKPFSMHALEEAIGNRFRLSRPI